MFQKKVTIGKNNITIEVSNEIGDVRLSFKKDTPKPVVSEYVYTKKLEVHFKGENTQEVKDYWYPQVELIINEIVNSLYSIGFDNLNPDKNFADYDLVKEDE